MEVIFLLLMVLAVLVSGFLGINYDVKRGRKEPVLYWTIGLFGGTFAGAFAMLCIYWAICK